MVIKIILKRFIQKLGSEAIMVMVLTGSIAINIEGKVINFEHTVKRKIILSLI